MYSCALGSQWIMHLQVHDTVQAGREARSRAYREILADQRSAVHVANTPDAASGAAVQATAVLRGRRRDGRIRGLGAIAFGVCRARPRAGRGLPPGAQPALRQLEALDG